MEPALSGEQFKQAIAPVMAREFQTEVDLWPHIRAQLAAKPVRRAPPRLAWTAAAGIAVFCLAATVYAVGTLLQQAMSQDRGITHVEMQGLGQALNIEQVIDGFTVRVEWAYADIGRIAIGYEITAPEGRQYSELYPNTYLIDRQGHIFRQLDSESTIDGATIGYVQDFDASVLDDLPDTLALRLVGRFSAADGDTSTVFGPISLNLDIPVQSGRRLPSPVTVERAGLVLTLQSVIVTPSTTRLEFCHPLDGDPYGRFVPVWYVQIGGERIDTTSAYQQGRNSVRMDQNCFFFRIDEPLYDRPAAWTVVVEAMVDDVSGVLDTPDLLERLNDGEAWETLAAEARARGLNPRIPGPWTFNVGLKG